MSPIADMLTQLKNAQARGLKEVGLPYSKVKFSILEILKNKGFVAEVEKRKKKSKKTELPVLGVELKYSNGVGAISGIKLVSRPSRRMYAGKDKLKPVKSGYGVAVVSTSRGIMTGDDAKKAGLGGEIICEIW